MYIDSMTIEDFNKKTDEFKEFKEKHEEDMEDSGYSDSSMTKYIEEEKKVNKNITKKYLWFRHFKWRRKARIYNTNLEKIREGRRIRLRRRSCFYIRKKLNFYEKSMRLLTHLENVDMALRKKEDDEAVKRRRNIDTSSVIAKISGMIKLDLSSFDSKKEILEALNEAGEDSFSKLNKFIKEYNDSVTNEGEKISTLTKESMADDLSRIYIQAVDSIDTKYDEETNKDRENRRKKIEEIKKQLVPVEKEIKMFLGRKEKFIGDTLLFDDFQEIENRFRSVHRSRDIEEDLLSKCLEEEVNSIANPDEKKEKIEGLFNDYISNSENYKAEEGDDSIFTSIWNNILKFFGFYQEKELPESINKSINRKLGKDIEEIPEQPKPEPEPKTEEPTPQLTPKNPTPEKPKKKSIEYRPSNDKPTKKPSKSDKPTKKPSKSDETKQCPIYFPGCVYPPNMMFGGVGGFGGYPMAIPNFGGGFGGYPMAIPNFGGGFGGYPMAMPNFGGGFGGSPIIMYNFGYGYGTGAPALLNFLSIPSFPGAIQSFDEFMRERHGTIRPIKHKDDYLDKEDTPEEDKGEEKERNEEKNEEKKASIELGDSKKQNDNSVSKDGKDQNGSIFRSIIDTAISLDNKKERSMENNPNKGSDNDLLYDGKPISANGLDNDTKNRLLEHLKNSLQFAAKDAEKIANIPNLDREIANKIIQQGNKNLEQLKGVLDKLKSSSGDITEEERRELSRICVI